MGGGDGGHLIIPVVSAEPSYETGLQNCLLLHLPSCYCSSPHCHLRREYQIQIHLMSNLGQFPVGVCKMFVMWMKLGL